MASTTILSDNGASSGSAGIKTTGGNDGVLILQTTTSGGTATNAVYVDTSQNVGLGVTPNTWRTNDKAIQIGGSTDYSNIVGSGAGITFGNNFYRDSGGFKYKNSYAAGRFDFDYTTSGGFTWNIAASGTAGNAITFTQAMTLDASGNLGVGTSSPAYRLDVLQSGATTISSSFAMARFTGANATANDLTLIGPNTSQVRINFGDTDAPNSGEIGYDHSANSMRFVTNGNERARITSAGQFNPGADNSYGFGGSGIRWAVIWAANGTIQTSDERQKNTITTSDLGLDFVLQLRPVSYKWNVGQNIVSTDENGETVITPRAGVRTHYGLIAQEVKEALGDKDFGGFIHDVETDEMGLRYDQFISPLIKAIQELKAIVDAQAVEIAALKGTQP